jgi:hypothetical protein
MATQGRGVAAGGCGRGPSGGDRGGGGGGIDGRGSAPDGGGLGPTSCGRLGPASVPVTTWLARGGAGAMGGRWLRRAAARTAMGASTGPPGVGGQWTCSGRSAAGSSRAVGT